MSRSCSIRVSPSAMAGSVVHRPRLRASRTGDRTATVALRVFLLAALLAGAALLERSPAPHSSRFVLAVGDALLGVPAAAPIAVRESRTARPTPPVAPAPARSAPAEAAAAIALRDAERALAASTSEVEPMLDQRADGWVPHASPVAPDTRRLDPASDAPIDLPESWTIEGGRYDGQEVTLHAAGGAGGYWRLTRARGGRAPRAVAWAPDSLPIRLVLERARGSWLGAHDSLVVWSLVRELERELGLALFRPADAEDVAPASPLVDGVRVRVAPVSGAAGRTYLSYGLDGRIAEASIHVASPDLLADRRVMKHELLHALGFGHTTAWSSLLTPGGAIVDATAEDVAHARAWYAVRAAQERGAGVPRIPAPAPR